MRGKGWGHLQERGRWSRFLLMNCCGWVVVVSASVEIIKEWAHWESRVGCVGS